MLPARRKGEAFEAKREDEITKVRPASLRLLRAMMDVVEDPPSAPEAPESGVRVVESGVGGPPSAEIRNALPTENTLEIWFSKLTVPAAEAPLRPTRNARARVALAFVATVIVTALASASLLWALFRHR